MAELLGDVFVAVSADTSKLPGEVSKATQKAFGGEAPQKAGSTFGNKAAKFIGKTLKVGTAGAVAGAGGVISAALWKGLGRLKALDQAEAKFRGLGIVGKAQAGIMESVSAAVKGTAFGLADAANAAASALGAGVKPGKDLSRYLKLTGDAAARAGTDFTTMSTIMDKVRGDGKLTGATLHQMTQNGLFALPALTKAYGVNQQEMRKMISTGKVSAQEFERILRKEVGGSALEMGDTFSGSLDNMNAALGRVGANILKGAFPLMIEAFQGAGKFLSSLEGDAEKFGAAFGEAVKTVIAAIKSINLRDLLTQFNPLVEAAKSFGSSIWESLKNVGDILGIVWGAIKKLEPLIEPVLAAGFAAVVLALKGAGALIEGVSRSLLWVVEVIENNTLAFGALAAVITGRVIPSYIAMTKRAVKSAGESAYLWVLMKQDAIKAAIANEVAAHRSGKAWIAARSKMMLAALGPGLIVAAVGLSVIAIVKHWDKVKEFISQVWDKITAGVSAAVDKISSVVTSAVDKITTPINAAFEGVKAIISGFVTWLEGYWSIISDIIAVPIGIAVGVFDTILLPAFNGLKAAVTDLVDDVLIPAFNGLATVVGWAADGIAAAWEKLSPVLEWVADVASAAFDTMIIGFNAMWDLVSWASDKISDALGKVRDGFDWVMEKTEPLRKAFKDLLEKALDPLSEGIEWMSYAIAVLLTPKLVMMGATALLSAAKVVLSWVMMSASAVASVITMGVQFALVVAGWVRMGAQAMIQAARMAAAWLIALGPIGVAIAAFALVVGLIVKYWDQIKAATAKVWNAIKDSVVRALDSVKTGVSNAVEFVKRTWDRIKEIIRVPVDFAKRRFDDLKSALKLIPRAFDAAKDGIKTAWDKVRGILTKPIKLAVDKAINPLAKGINKLVPGNPIPQIDTKGWKDGGYTGRLPVNAVAGVVHGDEHVIRAAARRKLEAQSPGALDYMNQTGRWPMDFGYKKGGRVFPVGGSKSWGRGYPGHTGVDFARPMGSPVYAASRGKVTGIQYLRNSYGTHIRQESQGGTSIYAHLSKVLVRLGQMLSMGQTIGKVGSTGNSTGPHLHFERRPPGTQSGTGAWLRGAGTAKGGAGEDEKVGAMDWLTKRFNFPKKIGGWIKSIDPGVYGPGLRTFFKDQAWKVWDNVKSQIGKLKDLPGQVAKSIGGKLKFWDSGGLAMGKGYMAKNTMMPERVLSPRQTAAFEDWMRRPSSQMTQNSSSTGQNVVNNISIELSMDDLSQLQDLDDLLKIIDKRRVTNRRTERSGLVLN